MLAECSLPPEAWCEVVGALELGLNTAVSDSTGKPPAGIRGDATFACGIDCGYRLARGCPECSHSGEGHSVGSMEAANKGTIVPEEVL